MKKSTYNKIVGLLVGILLMPFIASAINITVPSAPSAGYALVSTSTGAYIATTTDPFHVGSLYSTSTSPSTFKGILSVPDGAVGSPAVQFSNNSNTGIYLNGVNGLGLSGGGAGLTWNGTAFYPNTSSARNLGIASTNLWNKLFVNYASTTAISSTGNFWLNTSGYPQGFIGAFDASPIANVEINSQSQGPYTSWGLKNDNASAAVVLDNTNSLGGISPNVLLQNITGGGSGLITPLTSGNATAILRTYNGLGAIFNVAAPYQAAGTEPNVSMTMGNSDGTNNTLDLGLEDYPGTFPTGKQMYLHALASTFATPMPTMSFGWWNQGCGNSSNSTCSWGWLSASSTSSSGSRPGAVGTSTVIAIGDTWVNGYSKGGGAAGLDYGVQGVGDGTGATVQIVSTTTRSKALEVFKRSGSTYTSLLNVLNNGNIGVGTSSPQKVLDIYGAYPLQRITNSDSTQFAGSGLVLANNISSLGNQASTIFYNGINDASALQGYFGIDQGTTVGGGINHWLIFDYNTQKASLYTNGTEKLTITSAGNVGIGSTTPFTQFALGSGSIVVPEQTIATSTSMIVSFATSTQQLVRIGTSATTISFTKFLVGSTLRLITCSPNAVAGAITFTNVHYSGGVQPGNTTAANQCDLWNFIATNGTSTPILVLTGMVSGIQ